MKRINIHHFPQNPFQEQQHSFRHPYHFYNNHHNHHHHHSNYHRRHSFAHSHYGTGGSHYGSLHAGHPHHSLLSTFASRTLKPHLDLVRLSHVRDQLNLPLTATESNEHHGVSSVDDQTPPSPSTSQAVHATINRSFSIAAEDDRLLANFVSNYLGRDGVLVLYILQMNTNEVITGEIVTALYELFKTNIQTDTTE